MIFFREIVSSNDFKTERIINSAQIDKIEKILSQCHEKHWRNLMQYFNNYEKNLKLDRYVYIRISNDIKIIFYFQEKNQRKIYYPLLLDLHHSILGHSYKKIKIFNKWNFNDKREKMQSDLS